MLRCVAQALRQALSGRQLAGRLGGEEFAALLPECALAGALEWSENLRQLIFALHCEAGGSVERVTASFGVADWRPGMDTAAALMRAADIELFRAKAGGRNCVRSPA